MSNENIENNGVNDARSNEHLHSEDSPKRASVLRSIFGIMLQEQNFQ